MKATYTLSLFVIFFILTAFIHGAHAQNQTLIKGTVTTSDGKPAEFGTVMLDETLSKKTDKNGMYRFDRISSGQHTITVTYTGQTPQTKTVTVGEAEAAMLDFILTTNAHALNEVQIIGDKYTVLTNKNSESVSRMPVKNLENAQVYSVVGKEIIKEQMAITLEESFRNVPGAAPSKTGAGMPSFFSRGFQTSENFRNGMATYLKTGIDLAEVERVETIKGPTSTLFGAQMTSFGGIVNYVTKRPYENFGGEISYTAGSWDLNRLTADVNVPVKAVDGLLFRLNVAGQTENTFQTQGGNSTLLIAPVITYQVNDCLKLVLDADFLTAKGITPAGWFISNTLPATSFNQLNLNYRESLNDNSLISNSGSSNVLAEAQYKISDQWRSETKYTWGIGIYDDLYIFDFIWNTNSIVNRILRTFTNEKAARKNFQQNFIGDMMLGSMRNRIVAGVDYVNTYRNTRYDGLGYSGQVFQPVDLNNISAAPVIRNEQVEAILATKNTGQNMTEQSTYSAYASDILNLSKRLSVMASLRVDRFVNKGTTNSLSRLTTGDFSQTAFSPKFGLVFQPILDKVSMFANYINGFKNVGNQLQPNGEVSVFKPQQANQWETGIKLELMKKLSATFSYYDIQVTNSTRPELRNGQNFIVQDGTQVSRGFEAEVIANLLPGLNLVSSYGYNDNKLTRAAANVEGKRAIGMPKHVVNGWMSYSVLDGKVRGLGFGTGYTYVSDSFLNATNTFTLNAYHLLDAGIFYNRPRYRLSFKANNMLDKHYWVSDSYYARPQKPANFLGTVTYKF